MFLSSITVRQRVHVSSYGQLGFTLIELLVVLAIIGLLAAVATPKVMKHLGHAKMQTAKLESKNIAAALDLFRLDVGQYPTQEEGLKALLVRPNAVAGWNGPYLDKKEAVTDPWGGLYVYKIPGEHGEYDLISYGSDHALGGSGEGEDIVNW